MRAPIAGLVSVTVVLGVGLGVQAGAGQRVVDIGEWDVRDRVAASPKPEYPAEALATGVSGVVVAAVVFRADGSLASLDVLEAPHASMAAAVKAAVSRWTLRPGVPSPRGDPAPDVRGKLTFYFQVRGGTGVVLDPDQMPGGSARPARRTPASEQPSGAPPPASPPAPRHELGDVKTITMEEFERQARDAVLLDIGDRNAFRRGHAPGAVNIPLDELPIRGGPELPRDRTIVIDCTQEQKFRCEVAASRLAGLNFTRVALLVR